MRLENIDGQHLGYAYSYDNVSNILTKQTEHGSYGYDYDELYRLTDVDNPSFDDEAYSYDPVGNRLTASGISGAITHNANNKLALYGDISYEYDANGNMVSTSSATETRQYVYNVQNRLVRVEDDSGSVIVEYGYDPFGRRLWKENDGERIYFFYADEGLIAEYDSSGTELRSYGYQPDSTWTTAPLWMKQGTESYFYQNDHLGTPQKLMTMNGAVVWQATYSSFGKAQVDIETVPNNLRFPGQYYDVETEWHYNWFRYYDPVIGRYTKIDPIGFGGGDVNLYGYVWNNPVKQVDPQGLYAYVYINPKNPYSVLIVLPITYWGPGTFMEEAFNSEIADTWSGQIGDYKVTTVVIPGNENIIYIPLGEECAFKLGITQEDRAYVRSPYAFPNTGEWPSGSGSGTAAHEAGHLMGLFDEYLHPTCDPLSIMCHHEQGKPRQWHIEEIIAMYKSPEGLYHDPKNRNFLTHAYYKDANIPLIIKGYRDTVYPRGMR